MRVGRLESNFVEGLVGSEWHRFIVALWPGRRRGGFHANMSEGRKIKSKQRQESKNQFSSSSSQVRAAKVVTTDGPTKEEEAYEMMGCCPNPNQNTIQSVHARTIEKIRRNENPTQL
jgi:hypothetical protein